MDKAMAMRVLREASNVLTRQQVRTLAGQIKKRHADAAMCGLARLLTRKVRERSGTGGDRGAADGACPIPRTLREEALRRLADLPMTVAGDG